MGREAEGGEEVRRQQQAACREESEAFPGLICRRVREPWFCGRRVFLPKCRLFLRDREASAESREGEEI